MEFGYYIPGLLSIYLFFNHFFDTTFYLITYHERCISKYNKFKNYTKAEHNMSIYEILDIKL